ncbi:MAG: hypothetical protein ACJ8F3_18950 [Xanthobacteraceae bacterium]
MRTLAAFAVAVLTLSVAGPTGAQEQQSFRGLMGKGYDIKAVTFARGEATENREVFVITLQKEKSVAVCYFGASNWISLSTPVLDDARRCDVR